MQIIGLDHVQVAAPVGAEDDARRFYGGLLGLPELDKPAALQNRGGVGWHRPTAPFSGTTRSRATESS